MGVNMFKDLDFLAKRMSDRYLSNTINGLRQFGELKGDCSRLLTVLDKEKSSREISRPRTGVCIDNKV